MQERVEVGQACMLKLALEMPALVDEMDDEVAKAYPMKRLGEPSDIAEAALYFSDDSASGWVTGQTLILDGGGSIGFNRVG